MSSSPTVRRFRWEDLNRWTGLFNDINSITHTEKAWDLELAQQFLSQPGCKPEENCFVAELDGSPVGFALIAPELQIGRAVASGGVTERHRNQGIGRSLLEAAIKHVEALGASVLHVQVSSDSAAGRHLLESCGFQVVRTYYDMRWDGDQVPPPEPPPGFGIRSFVQGQDEGALTRLQNAAFGDSWGFCPNTVDEVEARLKFKTCDPAGVLFVADGQRLAGYNWTFNATGPDGSAGWIAMTGVHPDYRRQGIGRAAVLAGMRYLSGVGVRTIELEVDRENVPAVELYEWAGFRQVRQTLWYERAFNESS